MTDTAKRATDYLSPRFWPLWLWLGFLRLAILLPFRAQLGIGRLLGEILLRLFPKRASVARTNIRHCFLEYSDAEIERLTRRHLQSVGISFLETALCWWGSPDKITPLIKRIEGLEHIEAAKASGQGIILLTAHFTDLELGALFLYRQTGYAAVYRKMNNPLLEHFTAQARNRNTDEAIPKDNIKRMITLLRKGGTIWFAPDQQHQGSHSALVSFFGQPAHSATVTSSLAKLGRARVIPFFVTREDGGYIITAQPPLEDFPCGDEIKDTERYHRLIEEQVRHAPEQYLWVHKRFKGAPGVSYED